MMVGGSKVKRTVFEQCFALIEGLGILVVSSGAIGPVVLLGLWSFTHSWFWPDLLPREWSLRAWSYVISPVAGVGEALVTSLVIALLVALLSLFLAWPAARVVAKTDFRGRRLLLFLLLLPILAPPLASTMGMHALFLRYGLADTLFGVVLAHLVPSVPYATMVLAGSFSRFENGLEEQARILGASGFQVWRHVTVPAIRPGMAVAGAFAFLISWSQYLSTQIIGGGRVQTLPLSLVAFQRSGDEAIAAALSLLFLAPAVLVLLVVGRLMVTVSSKDDE
jgi:putative spermidine/putrescine transport system permease protein